MLIILTARNTSNMLQSGKHVCRIKDVVPAVPVREMPWVDKTPQMKFTFTKDGQIIMAWYNTLGYLEYSSLTDKQKKSGKFLSMTDPTYTGKSFAVDKDTKCRIIDAVFKVDGKEVNAPTLKEYNAHVEAGHELVGGNTLDALNIISKLAFDSGVEAGDDFTEADLIGRTVGIKIQDNNSGNARVTSTFAPANVNADADVAS